MSTTEKMLIKFQNDYTLLSANASVFISSSHRTWQKSSKSPA